MALAKRIALFLLTNILVITTISIVLNLLGVQPYLTHNGINFYNLAVFCLVWGMMGSIISLMMSRMMAKWTMGVKVIDPNQPGEFQWLVNMVEQISKSAGLPKTPEVGIWDSADLNAFATGPTKSRALVAFSSGLLRSMDRNAVEGVAAHEVAHIANGDMVTMTLIQGVVNAFVMFFARVIAYAISSQVRDEYQGVVRMITVIVLDILLSVLASMLVAWFSRMREFRADRGSAQYVGRDKMIAGLEVLQKRYHPEGARGAMSPYQISGRSGGLLALLATHPPLDARIAALKAGV